jgi:hypothetical protein
MSNSERNWPLVTAGAARQPSTLNTTSVLCVREVFPPQYMILSTTNNAQSCDTLEPESVRGPGCPISPKEHCPDMLKVDHRSHYLSG